MKKLHPGLCALGVLLITGIVVDSSRSATGQGQSNPPPLGVLVTNSSSQPVPVVAQGSSSVQGTVGIDPDQNRVKASQDGAWKVAIDGTPTVGVVSKAPQIFRHELWGIDNGPSDPRRSYTNSTNDLLVIEVVDGGVLYDQWFTLTVKKGTQQVADYILATPSKLPQDASIGHALTKIYVLPGETIGLPSTAFADLTGHFEPAP